MKSLSHEGIVEAFSERPRPMSFRKVSTLGTKGVGLGTEGLFDDLADFET